MNIKLDEFQIAVLKQLRDLGKTISFFQKRFSRLSSKYLPRFVSFVHRFCSRRYTLPLCFMEYWAEVMFNSFISFILLLFTDAIIQAVALEPLGECFSCYKNFLAYGILWLLLKLMCRHFSKLLECWIGSRTPWMSSNWYKWYMSCRRSLKTPWSILYELTGFSNQKKQQNYIQPPILFNKPSQPI